MRLICVLVLFLLPLPALAEIIPTPGVGDKRLRDAIYYRDEVYTLYTKIGYATYIEFAPGEEFSTFYTGDSKAWELGRHGHVVSIKPKAKHPTTNMILLTDKRIYVLDLKLSTRNNFYGVRFRYPNEERIAKDNESLRVRLENMLDPTTQMNRNYRYSAAGTDTLRPAIIFDNTTHTYLKFPEPFEWPAIYRVIDGEEFLVNPITSKKGNWMIVPRISTLWRLRLGKAVVCIRNDAFLPNYRDNDSETIDPAVHREIIN